MTLQVAQVSTMRESVSTCRGPGTRLSSEQPCQTCIEKKSTTHRLLQRDQDGVYVPDIVVALTDWEKTSVDAEDQERRFGRRSMKRPLRQLTDRMWTEERGMVLVPT